MGLGLAVTEVSTQAVINSEKSAFPQARLVALAECGTHAVFDVAIGPCRTSERELAHDLMDTLEPGMLLLADRGLYGLDM
ncbi:hypothetical protein [Rhodococcus jostii]|uniref:hypothetical protein n=1 Tax=Rhodococcus jostii TaxID=132919 RepID=UPI00362A5D0D